MTSKHLAAMMASRKNCTSPGRLWPLKRCKTYREPPPSGTPGRGSVVLTRRRRSKSLPIFLTSDIGQQECPCQCGAQ
eukprot:4856602-Karenia_brevis.AAC.1